MRQVVLDTETTGLEPEQGHRVVEIGCVELVDRRHTGRTFHRYLRPERDIDEAALEVHGITQEFLADKPRFGDVARDLLDFLRGAELVIHNAAFDVGFIDHELAIAGPALGRVADHCRILDTLALARRLHPGQRNSLEALCRRYRIDDSQRERHGALLDAEILADVYLAMTGGQAALALDAAEEVQPDEGGPEAAAGHGEDARERAPLPVLRASPAENEEHRRRLAAIEARSAGGCVWLRLEAGDAGASPGNSETTE